MKIQLTSVLISAVLVSLSRTSPTHAYITSPGAVPPGRQMKWLKQMTFDICQSKIGELSSEQVSQSRDLMYEWSHNPKLQSLARAEDCAIAVEKLLKRVVDENRLAQTSVELTVRDYNCVLEGWARSGKGYMAAERCEQILEAMIEYGPYPDVTSYKTCLMAWRQALSSNDNTSNDGKKETFAPYRAQRLLELMLRLYNNENKHTKKKDDKPRQAVMPDADCFDIVLQTWSRSGDKKAPRQTEFVLGVMDKLHRETGIEELKPRKLSLNAVLGAWAKSNDPTSSQRVAAIIENMELRSSQGDKAVEPDAASYNIVMSAFAHCPDHVWAAKKADSYVRHVVEKYKANPEGQLVPDTIMFNTAMGLWGKAKTAKGGSKSYRKARAILDTQIDLYQNNNCRTCKPDVVSFTSVIGCCAASEHPQERENAFKVALGTYRQLQIMSEQQKVKYVTKHGKEPTILNNPGSSSSSVIAPNHVTYGAMLKACAKLLPPSSEIRQQLVPEIFNTCRDAGCVGDMVISRLREVATPDLYKELMQGHSRKSIPEAWCINVHEQNEYRTTNNNKHASSSSNSKKHFNQNKRRRAEV